MNPKMISKIMLLLSLCLIHGCATSSPLQFKATPLKEILGQIQHMTVQADGDITQAKDYVDKELKGQPNVVLLDAKVISYSTKTPNNIFFDLEAQPCLSERLVASYLDLYGFTQTAFYGQPYRKAEISQVSEFVKRGSFGEIWLNLSPRHSQDKQCITSIAFSVHKKQE